MYSRTKIFISIAIIIGISLTPLIFWSFIISPFSLRFSSPGSILLSIGQITGIVGTTLFSLSLILSGKFKIFEKFFGGTDLLYIIHHQIGGIAFLLLIIHPLVLAFAYTVPFSNLKSLAFLKQTAKFILPGQDWTINLGIAAFMLMMSLMIFAFFSSLKHKVWLYIHKYLGLAFFLAAIHGLFVSSDISRYAPLRNYMILIILVSSYVFIRRTLFGGFLVKRYRYTTRFVEKADNDVLEIYLESRNKVVTFEPGQFIFIKFRQKGLSKETRPFSVNPSPLNNETAIVVRSLGNYPKDLENLQIGTEALIEEGFDNFSYMNAKFNRQIWIAGGIGIAPFLSMGRSQINPTYSIDLYYCVKVQPEYMHIKELQAIAQKNKNIRIFPVTTSLYGVLTAEKIIKLSGDIFTCSIFICGPPAMTMSLRDQFLKIGVNRSNLRIELFKF